jgi:hypothetical protein
MSRFRLRSRRNLYSAGLASLVCAAALAMSGCITFTKVGNDHYTGAIWQRVSDQIVWDWAGPTCDQDTDRNGVKGSPHDRALCGFYLVRVIVCNNIGGVEQALCNNATEANGKAYGGALLWPEFNVAAQGVANGRACLAFTYYATGDIKDWRALDIGPEGGRN